MKSTRLRNALMIFGALTLAAPLAPVPALTAQARATDIPSFAQEAKTALPAVVTVKVETTAPAGSLQPFPFQDPQLREFFKRFFGGVPNMPGQQGENGQPAPHEMGLGSGFFIDKSGLIVTNNHVVGNADKITVVTQDGKEYPAKLVGTDQKTDIAVIRIKGKHDFPTLPWGDSETTQVGDWVLAIGNPFGLGGTVTAGIVSARGRNLHSGPYDDFLQVDAPINRGNSGGPLLNEQGQVVGVNAAILSPSGGNIGIGFAIPSNMAREVVASLVSKGYVERGWLGVGIQPVTSDVADSLGLNHAGGALVASVEKDGPAAQAGIKTGDVIETFGDKKIETLRDLTTAVADTTPGTETQVKVWRSGETKTLNVTVAKMKRHNEQVASAAPGQPSSSGQGALGLSVRPGDGGLVVTDVAPNGEAASRGVQPGDVIVAVNQDQVGSVADLDKAVEQARKENRKSVLVLVSHNGNQHFVTLPLATG
jgi:serine protease Do